LKKYAIGDHTWQILKDTIEILSCFKKATDLAARHKYPTIYLTVPIYNFLLDMLEDNSKIQKANSNTSNTLYLALTAAIDKLKTYYSMTDIPPYYIGTGK